MVGVRVAHGSPDPRATRPDPRVARGSGRPENIGPRVGSGRVQKLGGSGRVGSEVWTRGRPAGRLVASGWFVYQFIMHYEFVIVKYSL